MMEKILKLETKTQVKVVLLLWLWWTERNKWREEGRRKTAVEVANIAAAMADRFQKQPNIAPLSENRQLPKRTKPQPGVFKINSNGAFDSERGHGGWGFVIKDDHGVLVRAGAGDNKFLMNPLHAELLGCLAGVRTAAAWA